MPKAINNWMTQDEVLGYIINSYEGVESVPNNPGVMRRIFLWEEDGDARMGNTEAFVLHLGRKFGLETRSCDACHIHQVLRDLGELIVPHRKHKSPRKDGPAVGRFKQPDPDEWTVGRKEEREPEQ